MMFKYFMQANFGGESVTSPRRPIIKISRNHQGSVMRNILRNVIANLI
jgi:hypothetical protein